MPLVQTYAITSLELRRQLQAGALNLIGPVVSTLLYIVLVKSGVLGRHDVDGVRYAEFVAPGLVLYASLAASVSSGATAIFGQKQGNTIYELHCSSLSWLEITAGFTLACALRSSIVGILVFAILKLMLPIDVAHPLAMISYLFCSCLLFALIGFCIGVTAQLAETLAAIPALLIAPLTFLGGAFYPLSVLPTPWRQLSEVNPVHLIVTAMQASFFGSLTRVVPQIAMTVGGIFAMLLLCRAILLSGWRVKQ